MNLEKSVLYLSYDGMTDPLGQSQVLPYLIGLSKAGYQFTLISFEKPERYLQNKQTIENICQENNIKWYPLSYTKKPPVLSTLKDIWKLRKTVFQLHKKQPFDLVHCRSYLASLIGLILKQRYKVPFIFDMRGFWADERVDGGLWNMNNIIYRSIYRYFKQKEKKFLTHADAIISLTHAGKEEMLTWGLPATLPIHVIPCCVDLKHFSDNNINHSLLQSLKHKYGITSENLVISYLGSIGTWYMLDEMLDFFVQVLKKYPKAKLLFITTEPASLIVPKANAKGIGNDQLIIESAKREEVPTYISLSHINLFFIKPAYSKKSSSPTKQGEIMAMGIPIVCNNSVGDVEYIIEKSGSGFVVNDFIKEEYDKVVEKFINLSSYNPHHIRKGAEKYFSLSEGIKSYENIYSKLLSN